MQSVKSDEPRVPASGEWEELRGRIRHRVTEALDLITILLQDAVILLAGFLAELAYETWLHSSHPFFQLAISLSSALFLLLYGVTATVHIVHYIRGQFGSTSAGVLSQWLPWALAAAGVIAAAVMATVPFGPSDHRPADVPVSVSRSLIGIAPADQLLGVEPNERNRSPRRPSRTALALSPDGQRLVFSAVRGDTQQLYMRALDGLDPTPIAGTDNSDSLFFSPDSKWVGFWKSDELKKVPVSGGPAVTICKTAAIVGASWGSNNRIIFAREFEGLWEVSADGGMPQRLTTLDLKKGEYRHRLPHILPGGRAVLFTIQRSLFQWDDAKIVVRSLVTGDQTTLIEGGADARYVPPGYVVYARQGALLAAPFDLTHLKLTGGAVGILDGVMHAVNTPIRFIDTGAAQFSVSDSGTLVYVPGGMFPTPERMLVWVDRSGATQALPAPPRAYLAPRLSPDGQRLAVFTQGRDRNVWVYDLLRGTLTRLTTDSQNSFPVWTPDGTRLAFISTTVGPPNLFWKPADGSGGAERLTTSAYEQRPGSWAPDGKTLAFVQTEPTTGWDIWTLSLTDGERTPRPFVQSAAAEDSPDFSPDGRWLAYASDESGRYEVYVQPFPGPGQRHQISAQGGTQPAWSRNGRELFYSVPDSNRVTGKMMAVAVATTPTFIAGVPSALGSVARVTYTSRGYDVSLDARRFITTLESEGSPEPPPAQMILVQNWVEELKRRVPTK